MKERQDRAAQPEAPETRVPAAPAPGWQPVGEQRPATPSVASPSVLPLPSLKRREMRVHAALRATTTFIDPVRDPATNELCYHASEHDKITSLGRRGAGLVCERPPVVGTRVHVQIHAPGERAPIEIVGRTCWTRVEFVPGENGARAVAAVGIEFMGASATSLDRYETWLARLLNDEGSSVATPPATG